MTTQPSAAQAAPARTEPDDLFSLLELEARSVAAAFGVPAAHELAAALVDRMHHRVGGGQVYIAKRSKTRRRRVHDAMKRDFTGANLSEVAERHGYSRVQAWRILMKK